MNEPNHERSSLLRDQRARTATLTQIRLTIVPLYMDPPPSESALRRWFIRAKIPKMKMGSPLRRGGGPNYWYVDAVEKLLKGRTRIQL